MTNKEPKQETHICKYCNAETIQSDDECYAKPKTLEEAAKEFVLSHDFSKLTNPNHLANRCFQFGAKWQQERMYSEEDRLKRSDKLWKKLVKELSVLNDNNYAARRLFDYIERHYRQPPQQPPITNN